MLNSIWRLITMMWNNYLHPFPTVSKPTMYRILANNSAPNTTWPLFSMRYLCIQYRRQSPASKGAKESFMGHTASDTLGKTVVTAAPGWQFFLWGQPPPSWRRRCLQLSQLIKHLDLFIFTFMHLLSIPSFHWFPPIKLLNQFFAFCYRKQIIRIEQLPR